MLGFLKLSSVNRVCDSLRSKKSIKAPEINFLARWKRKLNTTSRLVGKCRSLLYRRCFIMSRHPLSELYFRKGWENIVFPLLNAMFTGALNPRWRHIKLCLTRPGTRHKCSADCENVPQGQRYSYLRINLFKQCSSWLPTSRCTMSFHGSHGTGVAQHVGPPFDMGGTTRHASRITPVNSDFWYGESDVDIFHVALHGCRIFILIIFHRKTER